MEDTRTAASAGPKAPPADIAPDNSNPRWPVAELAGRYGLPALLLFMLVGFSIATPDTFASADNFSAILTGQTVIIVTALAVMLPLIIGEFDLSVSANAVFGSILVVGLVVRQGLPPVLAIVLAVSASTLIGLLNGLAVAYLKVNTTITTLGTSSVLAGLARLYTGDSDIFGAPDSLTMIGRGELWGLRYPVYYTFGICVVVYVVLTRTAVGRKMFAVGFGRRASELSGIRTARYTLITFAAAGLLAGLAGVIQGVRLGSASQNSLTSLLLPAFAAAFLGATTIRPGRYNVVGTVVAALFVSVAISGLQQLGAPTWVEPTLDGFALIIAVALSGYLLRSQAGRARREQEARLIIEREHARQSNTN